MDLDIAIWYGELAAAAMFLLCPLYFIPDTLKTWIVEKLALLETRIGLGFLSILEGNVHLHIASRLQSIFSSMFPFHNRPWRTLGIIYAQSYALSLLALFVLLIVSGTYQNMPELEKEFGGLVYLILYVLGFPISIVNSTIVSDVIAVWLARWIILNSHNVSWFRFVLNITMVFLASLILASLSSLIVWLRLEVVEVRREDFVRSTAVANVQYFVAFVTTLAVPFWITVFGLPR